MGHHKGRTHHGYRSEEEEDEELAQSQVAERLGSRGVGHSSRDGEQTEHRQNRPTPPDEIETGRRRRYQHRRRRHDHLPGWDETALRHTQRAQTILGVGAAPEIGDVVGEVCPDLQEERHGERRERGNEIEPALRPRHRAANQNR